MNYFKCHTHKKLAAKIFCYFFLSFPYSYPVTALLTTCVDCVLEVGYSAHGACFKCPFEISARLFSTTRTDISNGVSQSHTSLASETLGKTS